MLILNASAQSCSAGIRGTLQSVFTAQNLSVWCAKHLPDFEDAKYKKRENFTLSTHSQFESWASGILLIENNMFQ